MEVGEMLSESILRHNRTCDLGQTLYPLGPPAWYELILLEELPVACLLLSLLLTKHTHTHPTLALFLGSANHVHVLPLTHTHTSRIMKDQALTNMNNK